MDMPYIPIANTAITYLFGENETYKPIHNHRIFYFTSSNCFTKIPTEILTEHNIL